jgi:hypothetical protein
VAGSSNRTIELWGRGVQSCHAVLLALSNFNIQGRIYARAKAARAQGGILKNKSRLKYGMGGKKISRGGILTLLVPRADISAIALRAKNAASRYIGFCSSGEKCRDPIYRLKGILLQSIIKIFCVVIITFILHVICENFITNPFFSKKINKFISKKITSYCFFPPRCYKILKFTLALFAGTTNIWWH